MLITHKLSLDLIHPDIPERIHVKQGDALSRELELTLFCDREAWPVPAGVTCLVRWRATDPGTGESTTGIYDTLPGGGNAWTADQNRLNLILVPQMFARPGLVLADVALISGEAVLATFNFEFYVNQSPANGTEPQIQNYYKVASLEQINTAITALEEWQASTTEQLAHLEQEVFWLKDMINRM